MKWKERLWRNKWQLLVLILVMAVQCCFITQKQGYHMDELLTFELGNAEYNPWIVPTQPVGRLAKFMQQEIYEDSLGGTLQNLLDTVTDVLQNRGSSKLLSYQADVYEEPVWITREQFQDYITVGERDGFNYLSVYFNVKDDNHPPLYFMLVHMMSSIFRGRISPWMGCIFNLAAVMGCCILMFAMGRLLAGHGLLEHRTGELWGLCSGLLYGCSSGAIATTLFIRMYGVMTFLCVLTLYLHLRRWLKEGKSDKLLILTTVLGFWTQYFFLFYCLLLALVTILVLLRSGRRKEMLCYIRSMLIAAVIGVGVYPFAVKHILSSGRGVEAIGNLLSGLTGYGERLIRFGEIVLQRTFGGQSWGLLLAVLLVVGAGITTLWRRVKVKQTAQPAVCKEEQDGLTGNGRNGRWALLAMMIVPPLGYFLLAAKMSPYMVDRYIMPVFPFVSMALAGLVVYIAQHRKMAAVMIVCLLSAVNIGTYDGEYLYKGYERQLEVAEKYRELPCICIYEGYGFYDNLLEFATYEQTLLIKPSELAGRQTKDLEALDQAVVLIKQSADPKEALALLERYGLELEEVLTRESVHGDILILFSHSDGQADES